MKSVIQNKEDHQCYICKNFLGDWSEKKDLEEHHIFEGVANRKLSEKYGLKVYLCRHHHTGDINGSRDAVHSKGDNNFDIKLKQIAQMIFETEYGREKFVSTFGKNYL